MKSHEKQRVGRGLWGEGKGHTLGRDRRARVEEGERGIAHQPPRPHPGSIQPGLGAEKPSAPHLPLLLASSESCSLNYG